MIIGIDPGKGGGIALLRSAKSIDASVFKMPETEMDTYTLLSSLPPEIDMVYLERVGPMPKQGVTSVFTFGYGYGVLVGILTALKLPITFVSPVKWQRHLGCLSGGDKNVTKRKAQQLFPTIKVTHAFADALLIAEYGRQVNI